MKAQLDLNGLTLVGNRALNRADKLESQSAEQSVLQQEYQKFFRGLIAEEGFNKSPFEGNEEEIKSFFNKVKKRWVKRKQELVDDGTVTAAEAGL